MNLEQKLTEALDGSDKHWMLVLFEPPLDDPTDSFYKSNLNISELIHFIKYKLSSHEVDDEVDDDNDEWSSDDEVFDDNDEWSSDADLGYYEIHLKYANRCHELNIRIFAKDTRHMNIDTDHIITDIPNINKSDLGGSITLDKLEKILRGIEKL